MLENLGVFLNVDEFATSATLTTGAGVVSLKGIFDQASDPLGLNAEGRRITFLAKSSDLTNAHHGDLLKIASATYEVVGIEPQGDGAFTELLLKIA